MIFHVADTLYEVGQEDHVNREGDSAVPKTRAMTQKWRFHRVAFAYLACSAVSLPPFALLPAV